MTVLDIETVVLKHTLSNRVSVPYVVSKCN